MVYTERMMVRLTPREKAALEEAASAEHIASLAIVARKAIIEWLEARGFKTTPNEDIAT